ncbi:tetratricopeptide repeat protein [candidate division KSB1 bacterium]|nr:tetratricopeptide repeat protein [candidate division KSB1 bacterium]
MTCDLLKTLYVIALLLLLSLPSYPKTSNSQIPSDSKRTSSPTKKQELNNLRMLMREFRKVELATKCARNAVKAFSDSSFLPSLLFNLAEWEVRYAKEQFNLEMEKYALLLRKCEKDTTGCNDLSDPLIDYSAALKVCRRLLNDYPQQPFIDKIMYRTGVCLYETGKRDSAKVLFIQLSEQCPDSSYIPEVFFRIGECYFDEQQFEKALNVYNKIIESWDSPYFAMALYKRAWCYYQLNDYPQAVSTFFYLLKDIDLIEKMDTELLGKSQVELRDEALEYIAYCFTDMGGIEVALSFIKEIGGSNFTPRILQKMAETYFERDFFEEAIKVDKLIIRSFPTFRYAPDIAFNMFKSYNKIGQIDNAFAIRRTVSRNFGPRSKWARINNSKEDRENVNAILGEIDYVVATPYLQRADSLFTAKNYDKAIDTYKSFLKTFPKDERTVHCAFYLAESLYELQNYDDAALAYKHIVTTFPESEVAEDAAYNRIICYDLLIENAALEPDTLRLTSSGKLFKVPLNTKVHRKLIAACKDFTKWFPKSDKATEIELKVADIFMKATHYKLAEVYMNRALFAILKNNRGRQYYTKTLNMLAQANFKQEDFSQAEKWYKLLIKSSPDSAELIEKSKTMMASASYKVAESLRENGDANGAALKFERAAASAQDVKVAEAALFEAAIQFEKANKLRRAAINFEAFCKKYPDSGNYAQALLHAARNREKLSQWYLAAKNYIALYEHNPNSQEGASSLYNAGINYENAKDWKSMIKIFNDFLARFPNEKDRLQEALFKVGFAYEKSGKSIQANQIYRQLINNHQVLLEQGEFADDYIAARAQYRLGEMKHKRFSDLKLKPPFQLNMQRKQAAFNEMLEECVKVAKFNVAEWTTAAFYNIGYAYEEFSLDILNSPAPAELTEEQLKDYWNMINEKWVIPLETEALKYYKTNIELTLEHDLENTWTTKTKDRAAYLAKKLENYKNSQAKIKQAMETTEETPPTQDVNKTL